MNIRKSVVLLVVGLVLGACSGDGIAENILEGQEGIDNVDISENGGTVSLDFEGEDGEEGSITVGGGELPEDMPIDLPEGGEVLAVMTISGAGNQVSLDYGAGEFDSIKAFLENELSSSGFTEVQKVESSSPRTITWILQQGDMSIQIYVSEADDATNVTLLYGSGG